MEPEVTMFGLLIQLAVIIALITICIRAAMKELDMNNRPDPACDEHIKKTKEYLDRKRNWK